MKRLVPQIIQPHPEIPGDSPSGIMQRSFQLRGYTKSRALFMFGFLRNSEHANAHKVYSETIHWIISDHKGKILAKYEGFAFDMPKRFKRLIAC